MVLGLFINCAEHDNEKVALLGLGLIFVSAAANAISFNGSAGQDYTHLGRPGN